MKLPLNGKIIIIDDQEKEALPIIQILNKHRIPFNYYKGNNHEEFPDDCNLNKLRILFLDLNIFEKTTSEIKDVISSLDAILKKIIPDYPNPYLLVVWSKKDKEYIDALKKHFDDKIPNKKPSEILFLQKSEYFDYLDGEWTPQADCIERLIQDLNTLLENVSVLKALIKWENLVYKSTDFTIELFNECYPCDDNWNNNMKGVLYTLAKALAGNNIKNIDDMKKQEHAFLIINEILFDSIEEKIRTDFNINIGAINEKAIGNEIKHKLNSKIHLSFNSKKELEPFQSGNVYIVPPYNDNILKEIIVRNFNIAYEDIMKSNPIFIELDVTPPCDHAQYKEYVRIVPGLAVNPIFQSKINKKALFNYNDIPIVKCGDENMLILLDYRYTHYKTITMLKERNVMPVFRLRHELLVDIQSKLAMQMIRPGIVSIK